MINRHTWCFKCCSLLCCRGQTSETYSWHPGASAMLQHETWAVTTKRLRKRKRLWAGLINLRCSNRLWYEHNRPTIFDGHFASTEAHSCHLSSRQTSLHTHMKYRLVLRWPHCNAKCRWCPKMRISLGFLASNSAFPQEETPSSHQGQETFFWSETFLTE